MENILKCNGCKCLIKDTCSRWKAGLQKCEGSISFMSPDKLILKRSDCDKWLPLGFKQL